MADELQCIRQHQQKHSALVRVIDANWLRRCGAGKRREDEAPWVINPAASLGEMRRMARVDDSDVLLLENNREGSRLGCPALANSSDGVCLSLMVPRSGRDTFVHEKHSSAHQNSIAAIWVIE